MTRSSHRPVFVATVLFVAAIGLIALGEVDDSPGLMLIGLVLAGLGYWKVLRRKR